MNADELFLVLYDYGQGGLWAYLRAASADEIRLAFPDLVIVPEPPDWMEEGEVRRLQDDAQPVNGPHHGFLAELYAGGRG